MTVEEVIPYFRDIAPRLPMKETVLLNGEVELRYRFCDFQISCLVKPTHVVGTFTQTVVVNASKASPKTWSREIQTFQELETFVSDCREIMLGRYAILYVCLFDKKRK